MLKTQFKVTESCKRNRVYLPCQFVWGRDHTFQVQIFLGKHVSKYANTFRDSVETIERQHQCLCRVCCLGLLWNTVTVFCVIIY